MCDNKIDSLLSEEPVSEDVAVVDVQFRTGSKVYYFDPQGLDLKAGEHIIIETARGIEYGLCASDVHTVPQKDIVPPLRQVIRRATAQDERTAQENRAKEKKAYAICLQKIADHKLDMQLASAEYAFDGSKILFFFTADDRVDFRELVRDLASVFRTRIELRQIGVRDKAKMVGGLGICGRPFCCAQFLEDFQPVSIKMAKTQNLSLNPTKISGTCGRLMCCLKYEQEAYEDLIRTSPKSESFVDTPDGRGTVTEVNLLRQSVKVRMEEHPEEIGCYKNCDICVLRNGKGKKTDPPIPADLAPISGDGKRPPKQEDAPEHMSLDPIRFRYRPDEIVPEAQEEAEDVLLESEEHPERRQPPRRRKKRPQEKAPEASPERTVKREVRKKQDSAAPKEADTKEAAKEGEARKNNQNRNRPRREHRPQADRRPQGQRQAESAHSTGSDGAGNRSRNAHRHNSRRPNKKSPNNSQGGNTAASE